MKDTAIKDFYRSYGDRIIDKRSRSPYQLRQYVHHTQYAGILSLIEPGMTVLDAGCGEGVLSVMMAQKGAVVTGCDLSEPNIKQSRLFAKEKGVTVDFVVADAEFLPFPDSSFDLVVSSHVLEHLPDFDKGLQEVMRVTKKRAVVAIPTLPNPCSLVQVGHGWFYLKGPRSFLAFPYGLLRTIGALVLGHEGVDEHYVGTNMPHIFRFPWILPQKAARYGYRIIKREASTLCLPYFESLLPITRALDQLRDKPFFRNLGYGTTYLIEKPTI